VQKCPHTLQNTSQIRVYTNSTIAVLTNSIISVWCCCCVCDMAVVTSLCCRHIPSSCCVLHHTKQQPKLINASNFCTAVQAKRDELLGSLHTQCISTGTIHSTPQCPVSLSSCRGGMHGQQPKSHFGESTVNFHTMSTHPSAAQCLPPVGAVACPSTGRFPIAVCMHPLADTVRQSLPAIGHQGQKLPTSSRATHTLNELPRCLFVCHGNFRGFGDPPWTEQYKGSSR
jgi:hypothetical protein